MPTDIAGWVSNFQSMLGIAELGALAAFLVGLGAVLRLIRTARRG